MRGHCHQLSRYQIVCWKRSGYFFNALFHGLFGCLQNGYECFNHIRTIAVIDNQIYACGTGAYKPTAFDDEHYGLAPEQVHLGLGQTSAPVTCPSPPSLPSTRFIGGLPMKPATNSLAGFA